MAEGEKKTERRNLTITHVEEIKKVGDKQIPKLPFKAKDGDTELAYFTFRSSLFEAIKVGQTINADVETSERVYDGRPYTDRRVVQVYVEGQPIGGKGQGYRGRSPEELEQQARLMILAYAKDLAVAKIIPLESILPQADMFHEWLKGQAPKVATRAEPKPETKPPDTNLESEIFDESEAKAVPPSKIQNITEFKALMAKHKVGTREAYEILSIGSFMELVNLDESWKQIKEAKGIA